MPKKKKEKTEKNPVKEKITEKEFEAKVVELSEKGLTAEKIGETLRQQGIHPKEYGKISKILKAKNLYQVPEIQNLKKRVEAVSAHSEKNRQDKRAIREKERLIALLKRQKEYHKISQ